MTASIHTIRLLVHRLAIATHPYRDNKSVTREPSLTQLRNAIRSDNGSTGTGRGGASNSRVPLDTTAFELYEDITGQIDTLYHGAIGIAPQTGTPEQNLIDWFEVFTWDQREGKISDLQLQVAHDRLTRFETRIEHHFAPPRIVELQEPCPLCDARYVILGDGTPDPIRITALIYHPLNDGTVWIECRDPDCRGTWYGEAGIAVLTMLRKLAIQRQTQQEQANLDKEQS